MEWTEYSPLRRLSIDIPSRVEDIELVAGLLERLLAHLGLDEDKASHLVLALREGAANAVQHGNELDPAKRAKIDLRVRSSALHLRIEDQGSGFDPDALPDPLAPENLLKPTGRGILLMRNFMDEVAFEFPEAGGTVVTMRVALPTVEAGSDSTPDDAEASEAPD